MCAIWPLKQRIIDGSKDHGGFSADIVKWGRAMERKIGIPSPLLVTVSRKDNYRVILRKNLTKIKQTWHIARDCRLGKSYNICSSKHKQMPLRPANLMRLPTPDTLPNRIQSP
jgi:hypothetical protein